MPDSNRNSALRIVAFPGGYSSDRVRPLIGAGTTPYYDALTRGELLLPQCEVCQRVRTPGGSVCPWCGSPQTAWIQGKGHGVVHSWVRYHRAYLSEFEALVPYAVLAVRLPEGPVLFGRLLSGGWQPTIGATVRGVIERWADGFCGLAFEPGTGTT